MINSLNIFKVYNLFIMFFYSHKIYSEIFFFHASNVQFYIWNK